MVSTVPFANLLAYSVDFTWDPEGFLKLVEDVLGESVLYPQHWKLRMWIRKTFYHVINLLWILLCGNFTK